MNSGPITLLKLFLLVQIIFRHLKILPFLFTEVGVRFIILCASPSNLDIHKN